MSFIKILKVGPHVGLRAMSNPVLHMKGIQDYLLTRENITRLLAIAQPTEITAKGIRKQAPPRSAPPAAPPPIQPHFLHFPSSYTDTLFWSFYVIHKGLKAYEIVGNAKFELETQAKFEVMEELGRRRKEIKGNKNIDSRKITDQLTTNRSLSTPSFLGICSLYGHNIMAVSGRRFFEVMPTVGGSTRLVVEKEGCFDLFIGDPAEQQSLLEDYRATHWKVEPHKTQLKALGGYKLQDLKDIAERLELPLVDARTGKALRKKDLYTNIKEAM